MDAVPGGKVHQHICSDQGFREAFACPDVGRGECDARVGDGGRVEVRGHNRPAGRKKPGHEASAEVPIRPVMRTREAPVVRSAAGVMPPP